MTPVEFDKIELSNLIMLVRRQILEIQLEKLEKGEAYGHIMQLNVFEGIYDKLYEIYKQERKQNDAP